MTTTKLPTITFETHTCTRCGGSGQYPSACWNGVCLGCSGAGVRHTRAGRNARARYNEVMACMTHTYGDVKVGDRVKASIARVNSTASFEKWLTVTAINVRENVYKVGDGPWMNMLSFDFDGLDTTKYTGIQAGTDMPIMIWDRDIYLEAINACRRLKGATIVDPELPLTTPMGTTLVNADNTPVMTTPRARGSHADCDHEATPAARRRCRATRA